MSKKLLPILIIVLLLVAGAIVWWKLSLVPAPSGQPPVSTASQINPEELMVFEVKLENLSDYQTDQAFNRFTAAKNTITQNKTDGLVSEDNANFYGWLDIAGAQKTIGDYDRAAKLWQWFTEVHAGNSISPANLGDLYKSFIVDKDKSEYYYKIALEREQRDFQIYYGLYELYRYLFEDPDQAVQVLKDGMANNPDNRNYVSELVNYLISIGRKGEAGQIIDQWVEAHPEDYAMRAKIN